MSVGDLSMADLEDRIRNLEMQMQFYAGLRASQGTDGLMSLTDKTKLDSIATPLNSSGTVSVTDFNAIRQSGFYEGNSPTGAPYAGAYWFCTHTEHISADGYSFQIAQDLSSGANTYVRGRTAGSWNAWKPIQVDSGWQTPTFLSGYSSWSGWPVQYRKVNDLVTWRGLVTNSATLGSATCIQVSAGYTPAYNVMHSPAASANFGAQLSIAATSSLVNLSAITAGSWVSLHGLFWYVN